MDGDFQRERIRVTSEKLQEYRRLKAELTRERDAKFPPGVSVWFREGHWYGPVLVHPMREFDDPTRLAVNWNGYRYMVDVEDCSLVRPLRA